MYLTVDNTVMPTVKHNLRTYIFRKASIINMRTYMDTTFVMYTN